LDKAAGALVAAVDEPWRGSFQEGDVILTVSGKTIEDDRFFTHEIAGMPIGKTVPVTTLRDGVRRNVPMTVAAWTETEAPGPPADAPGADAAARTMHRDFGWRLDTINDAMRAQYNLDAHATGIIVAEVTPSTPAAQSEVEAGDMILRVQHDPVTSID